LHARPFGGIMAGMFNRTISRRKFLSASAIATGLAIVPRHVLGGVGQTPPSEILTHAVIGVGGMGTGHLHYVLDDKQARLLGACDVDSEHLKAALKLGGESCKGYSDFRELLDRRDIDVIHIATPPHWHALMAIAAAEAGFDIWCEKPMSRTIGEGRYVIDAVQRNGRIFRLNTWFRLHDQFYGLGTTVKPIKQIISAGLLGWPLTVRVSRFTGFDWKVKIWSGRTDLKPQSVPANFDYNTWLGPAPYKPYHSHRTHQTFRGYWDYDGGGLADMGQHYLDPVQYFLDKDGTSPVEIEAKAPWPAHPDAVQLWGQVYLTYADGCKIILESGDWGKNETEKQPYIEGPNGRIYPGFRTDPVDMADVLPTLPEPEPMISDFATAVKTRQKFGLNEGNGHRSCSLVNLANIAIRTGRKLKFDPDTMLFIGDDEANRLINQPMRAPWHLS
jgi:predicted dehydrogenase